MHFIIATGGKSRAETGSTSDGFVLKGVRLTVMQSGTKHTFAVGDTLDFDRPSGGFSLQICWTTGYVAGSHVAAHHAAARATMPVER